MLFTLLLTALLVLFTSIYLYFYVWFKLNRAQLRQQYAQQGIPFAHVPNVMVQAYWGLRPELIEDEAIKKNGKVFGTDLFGTKTIFVAEPALIQLILSKEFTSFTNRRKVNFNDPYLANFLTSVTDEKWKRIRSIVTPTFSTGKLKLMKPRIDDSVATLMQNIENSQLKSPILNMKEMFGAYTLDTIMQVGFGTKSDTIAEPNNEIVRMVKSLFAKDVSAFETPFLQIIFAFPGIMAAIMKATKATEKLFGSVLKLAQKLVEEKREQIRAVGYTGGKANNFLEMLLEAEKEHEMLVEEEGKNENDSKKSIKFMTTEEIIAQCVAFFFLAYDSSTSNMSLVSYHLAQNESIQERLYKEIVQFLAKLKAQSPDPDVDPLSLITFESLSQLEYLNAVVSETLRLYPPVPSERTASRDIILETEDGQHRLDLKKDDIIRIPIYAIHRDAEQFPDPETFDPTRFLHEQPAHHRYAYLPMGQGPRNCVATKLALYEIKLALLNVFYRYRVSICSRTTIPVQFYNNGQILNPRDIFLKLERRTGFA